MDVTHDEGFMVFVRNDHHSLETPEMNEQAVGTCSSYEEARRIRDELHGSARECIIRYVGEAGGGD
jgi:hypothetical protein